MQQIEGVVDDCQPIETGVMKSLKRRAAVPIECYDLAVDQRGSCPQPFDRTHDTGKLGGDILEIPRGERYRCAVLDRLRAVAVPFDLIRPLVAGRQSRSRRRHHGSDRAYGHERTVTTGGSTPPAT